LSKENDCCHVAAPAVIAILPLESHKNANASKAWFLVWAVSAEILAVGLLAVAVAVILSSEPWPL
jgi:hypothetical protein